MIYMVKRNADNGDAARVSMGCGTDMIPVRSNPPPPPDDRRKREEECFGVPRLWFLPFVGVAIILIGIFSLLEGVIPDMPSAWPLIIIIFGVLIILAAIYRPKFR